MSVGPTISVGPDVWQPRGINLWRFNSSYDNLAAKVVYPLCRGSVTKIRFAQFQSNGRIQKCRGPFGISWARNNHPAFDVLENGLAPTGSIMMQLHIQDQDGSKIKWRELFERQQRVRLVCACMHAHVQRCICVY